MAANRIYIQVDFQSSQADAQIKALNRNLADIGTTASKSTAQASTAQKGFSLSIEQSSRAVSDLTQALAGLAVIGLGAQMVRAADEINRARIALETMTGSAETAKDMLNEIRRISQSQPFEFAELTSMTQRLKAFGFEAAQIPGMVETISDSVAALGGNKTTIDSITLALGQMSAKGVAQGQELYRQLTETGVRGAKYLRAALKEELKRDVSELDLRAMIEKGAIEGQKAVHVILKGMEEDYGGVGKRIADELISAQFTKLIDDIKKLAQVLNDQLGPGIASMLRWVRDLVSWFTKLPPEIKAATVAMAAFISVASVAPSVLNFLSFIPANLKIVTGAFAALSAKAATFTAFLALLRSGTMASIPAWLTLGGAIASVGTALAVLITGYGAYKGGQWLREIIPEEGALREIYKRFSSNVTLGASQDIFGLEDRDALRIVQKVDAQNRKIAETLATNLRTKLAAAGAKAYEGKPVIPYGVMTDEQLEETISNMKIAAAKIAEERRFANQTLLQESKDNQKHQAEIARQALDRAKAQLYDGLGAIEYEFAGIMRQLVGAPAEVVAEAVQAANIRRDIIIRDFAKGMRELNRAIEIESTKAQAEAAKRAADTALEKFAAIAPVALAQAQAIEDARLRIAVDAATKATKYKGELETDRHEKELAALDDQLKKQAITRKMYDDKRNASLLGHTKAQAAIVQEGVDTESRLRIESERKTLEIIQRMRELQAEREIQKVEQRAARRMTYAEALPEIGAENIIANEELRREIAEKSAQEVLDIRKKLNQDEMNDQVKATQAAFDYLQTLGLKNEAQTQAAIHSIREEYGRRETELVAEIVYATEKLRLDSARKILEVNQREREEVAQREIHEIERRVGTEQARVEARPERDLESMIANEKDRVRIAAEGSQQILAIRLKLIEAEKQAMLDYAKDVLDVYVTLGLITEGDVQKRLGAIRAVFDKRQLELKKDQITEEERLRLESQKRIQDAIYQEQKTAFDNLKDAAGRVFDALLQKSTSVWQAIANVFKTTILTAIRDIVSSHVAKMLYQLFNPGQTVVLGPYGRPTFGGAGGGGAQTPLNLGQWFKQAIGFSAPVSATTAPYNPNAAAVQTQGSSDRMMQELGNIVNPPYSGVGATTGAGAATQVSRLAQMKDRFNIGKVVSTAMGDIPWSKATPGMKMGSILASPGFAALAATVGVPMALAGMQRSGLLGDVMTVGGAALTGLALGKYIGLPGPAGAILGAGVGLFARGVQRGGAKGLVMTTAGGFMAGAMIGLRLGGIPGMAVGAIVGTAVGAITGTVRLFIKTAEVKLREKVKAAYGIDIRERNVRLQILEVIKEKYGGDLDRGIRAPEIVEMIQLYAMTTGQAATGVPRSKYGVTGIQAGGAPQIQPVYSGGGAIPNPYTGWTTSQANTGGQPVYVQLDPRMAQDMFEGRVVNVLGNQPGAVANANAYATRAGTSRVAQRGTLLEPLTVAS